MQLLHKVPPGPHTLESNGSAVMPNPLWMLAPWLVVALAAGIKFWRLTSPFRQHRLGTPSRTERQRQLLERTWEKDQQVA